MGLRNYGGMRGNVVAIDVTVAALLGASSPAPSVAVRRAERAKVEKYDEAARANAGPLRFVPFAVSEFGALGPHAQAFLVELAKLAAPRRGVPEGKWLSSWRRKFSLVVNMAHADNALSGVAAAAAARDDAPAPRSSVRSEVDVHMSGPRAAGAKRLCVPARRR